MRPLLVKTSWLWDVSFGKIRIGKRVYIFTLLLYAIARCIIFELTAVNDKPL